MGRYITGFAQLCVVGLHPTATQQCRSRLFCRRAATHRIQYRVATMAIAGLATIQVLNVANKKGD